MTNEEKADIFVRIKPRTNPNEENQRRWIYYLHRSKMSQSYSQSSQTSRSIASTRNSILIKRATASNDLKPSDILIERFQVWKSVCDTLLTFFKGVNRVEQETSNELHRLGNAVHEVLPLRSSQFLDEGGLQDILYGVRENTRIIAEEHDALAKIVHSSIVLHLQKLKTEVKLHIRNIIEDTGKLATLVASERESSTRLITSLTRSIAFATHSPLNLEGRQDPWLCNQLVVEQLRKQVQEENMLQKSILIMQTNSAQFEEGLVRAIQSIWAVYHEYNTRKSGEVYNRWANSANLIDAISPTTEWEAFSSREDCLLDPDTPLRNPQKINYPGMGDPCTIPIHQGILWRKKRYTRSYGEGYFVITPAGYLHEFKSSDIKKSSTPELSIFLLECTLGAPTHSQSRTPKFNLILGKKSKFNREQAYTFRAKNHDELMIWWNALKELCKVYLISSIPQERGVDVQAAVRAVGYGPEEEEEEVFESEEEIHNRMESVEIVRLEARRGSSQGDETSTHVNERFSSTLSASSTISDIPTYHTSLDPRSEAWSADEEDGALEEDSDLHVKEERKESPSELQAVVDFKEDKISETSKSKSESSDITMTGILSRFTESFIR
ncbi:Pleckstrin domain-containing protein [Melampsora larici-populina 98AG31]|uniref:Pleckstrin domain-containing protein n=1 Tax=Melampsora larici-populina (strain 98AG31 / pathotype 3-4-7) TaxID=747676 RepID=F4R303_MELLP|nr:Pleckstrin domain-containing protein [Melampsora larici-populina 98AG31]EGG12542.1 Pleckstrin domain-containing protein [Melampsora larici-populina 98AG31]